VIDGQRLIAALGRVVRLVDARRARGGCCDVRCRRERQADIRAAAVAFDAGSLCAALADGIALRDVGATIAVIAGQRSAIDVDAIAHHRVGGRDDVDAGGAVQSAAGEINCSRIVHGRSRIVCGDGGVLFAGCSNAVHLGLGQRLLLMLLRVIVRLALTVSRARDD